MLCISERGKCALYRNKYVGLSCTSSLVQKSLSFRQHIDKSEMLIRGMNVVVLSEVTGAVMSSRWYDTYESLRDSRLLLDHLQGLRRGRILCFAIKVVLALLLISFFYCTFVY